MKSLVFAALVALAGLLAAACPADNDPVPGGVDAAPIDAAPPDAAPAIDAT